MKNTFRSFAKCGRGTVAVEFAVIGGFAIFVLLGGVEYATWIRDQRSVSSTAAAAAQSISDSASSTGNSRATLENALNIMSGGGNGDNLGLKVYHVTAASDGTISLSDTWSAGSTQLTGGADANEWQLISAYLVAGEGGVVACSYKMHNWRFLPLMEGAGSLMKSCSAGVPIEVSDIDWQ